MIIAFVNNILNLTYVLYFFRKEEIISDIYELNILLYEI